MTRLYLNIKSLIGILPAETRLLKGKEMNRLECLDNAWLMEKDGVITDFGLMENLPKGTIEKMDETVLLHGRYLLPAWCDSHTHLVFAKWRESEFMDKLNGLSYEEIAHKGGGILNSAKALQDMSENQLFDDARKRLFEIKEAGTGAVEIKSGYGLSYEGELKMLRVIKQLKEKSPLTIKATFLGAHSYPMEFRNDHEGYLKILIEKLLPQIAEEGLADFVDVFCEDGFFSADETNRILEAAAKYGLQPKIHANELAFSGGIEVGVKNNARSVDHLECTGDEQIKALLNSETMPTLLPSTSFFLKIPYAPARKMIDAGLPVALASDYNPGTSPSGNMPFVLSLASIYLGMTTAEAINAATINGAYAMGLEKTHGSITRGKQARFIITEQIPSLDFIPYRFGTNWIDKSYTFVNENK